jgi:hypothetical protein
MFADVSVPLRDIICKSFLVAYGLPAEGSVAKFNVYLILRKTDASKAS